MVGTMIVGLANSRSADMDNYISHLDLADQPKLRELITKYPFLGELTSGYLRHREFERLKAELETDISEFGITKAKWLTWYSSNTTLYDQMATDLERARGTISLLASELALARDQIRKQNRSRKAYGLEKQIPLFHAA